MCDAHDFIFQWLFTYAHQPGTVYLAVFGMMLASGFGLPIPEEVTIVSIGLLSYIGAHPEACPPGTFSADAIGGAVVNPFEAALVTFASVAFADVIVFSMGRFFGRKLMRRTWFHKLFPHEVMHRVEEWMKKYGMFAAFLFRFTPGLRFPAHILMGFTRFPMWQFAMMDGIAALISVPTQILVIYYYGEPILKVIKQGKYVIGAVLAILLLIVAIRKWVRSTKLTEAELGKQP